MFDREIEACIGGNEGANLDGWVAEQRLGLDLAFTAAEMAGGGQNIALGAALDRKQKRKLELATIGVIESPETIELFWSEPIEPRDELGVIHRIQFRYGHASGVR